MSAPARRSVGTWWRARAIGLALVSAAVDQDRSRHERLLAAADVALRAVSVAARAAFMVISARWLSLENYAALALTMALTGYLIYVAGLDFYVSAHRELLAQRSTLAQVVRAQAAMSSAGLVLALPLLWLLLAADAAPLQIAIASILLVGEAGCAELSRLLVAVGRPSAANGVNFLKAAGWMLPMLAGGPWIEPEQLLATIYAAWGLGLVAALMLGTRALGVRPQALRHDGTARGLIRQHLRLMPVLVLGTLALRAAFSLDRVFIEWAGGAAALAPYALFAGMGAAFMALVDAGVVARLYPPLVAAVARRDLPQVRAIERSMLARTLLLIAVMVVVLWLGLDLLLAFVDKPEFSAQVRLAWIVAAAYASYALSTPSHLILYGLSRDRLLTGIHAATALLLCGFGAVAVAMGDGIWVAWGVLASLAYMGAHKACARRRALAQIGRDIDERE